MKTNIGKLCQIILKHNRKKGYRLIRGIIEQETETSITIKPAYLDIKDVSKNNLKSEIIEKSNVAEFEIIENSVKL